MKVITFSRHFPKGQPKEGRPTYFVERIAALLTVAQPGWTDRAADFKWMQKNSLFNVGVYRDFDSCKAFKSHTIRGGNRWKVGDWASLRVWSGNPYNSKQKEFAKVIIQKVWTFEITKEDYLIDGNKLDYNQLKLVAANDGLDIVDFECWFAGYQKGDEVFRGQIICWDDKIEY